MVANNIISKKPTFPIPTKPPKNIRIVSDGEGGNTCSKNEMKNAKKRITQTGTFGELKKLIIGSIIKYSLFQKFNNCYRNVYKNINFNFNLIHTKISICTVYFIKNSLPYLNRKGADNKK